MRLSLLPADVNAKRSKGQRSFTTKVQRRALVLNLAELWNKSLEARVGIGRLKRRFWLKNALFY